MYYMMPKYCTNLKMYYLCMYLNSNMDISPFFFCVKHSPDRRTILLTFYIAALTSCDLILHHVITARPRCCTSGCTPSLIVSSPTAVWSPSPFLSLTMAGGAARTVHRAVQCPRFSSTIMKSFGAEVFYDWMPFLAWIAIKKVCIMCVHKTSKWFHIFLGHKWCPHDSIKTWLPLCGTMGNRRLV